MAVPIRLSDAVDLYDEAIQRVFDGKYTAHPETYKLLCDVGDTEIYLEKRSAFTGFSMAKQLGENEAVQYESPDQGLTKNGGQDLVKSLLINWERFFEPNPQQAEILLC